jgi:hypothetical protein
MLKTYLDSEPFPHFEAHPDKAGLLVRIEEDGSRTVGRFVNRTFVPVVLQHELDAELSRQGQRSTGSTSA